MVDYVSSSMATALGILLIIDYSVIDTRKKLIIQFVRIALIFTVIGYNLPRYFGVRQALQLLMCAIWPLYFP